MRVEGVDVGAFDDAAKVFVDGGGAVGVGGFADVDFGVVLLVHEDGPCVFRSVDVWATIVLSFGVAVGSAFEVVDVAAIDGFVAAGFEWIDRVEEVPTHERGKVTHLVAIVGDV